MQIGDSLPAALVARPVRGVNLGAGSFGDQLAAAGTLVVFLRHFGCTFCREMIDDVRDAARQRPDFPAVLFVFRGEPHHARERFAQRWPEARVVTDADGSLYDAFAVRYGGLWKMAGPAVFGAFFRALRKGHFIGWATPDPLRHPGVFLIEHGRVTWKHEFAHVGDHPDFRLIPCPPSA